MKSVRDLELDGLRVLDGGLATALEARGCDLSGPLWSGQVIEDSPATVAAVHRDFLEAGADCLMTASYQISSEGYREIGARADRAESALQRAVKIALDERDHYRQAHPRKVWIAASLGPYGARLHNGAEYHGNYDCGFSELVEFHSRRLAVVSETDADFVAFETIPSLAEGKAIAAALERFPEVPAAVSFTCRDGAHVAHGERLADCAAALNELRQVIAIGVNCVPPRLVSQLLEELRGSTTKRRMVYPNSGEQWDMQRRKWTGESRIDDFRRLARAWRAGGADWIGGCCRTGPEHIRAIREALNERDSAGGNTDPQPASGSPT